jgi:hypothetical protein
MVAARERALFPFNEIVIPIPQSGTKRAQPRNLLAFNLPKCFKGTSTKMWALDRPEGSCPSLCSQCPLW